MFINTKARKLINIRSYLFDKSSVSDNKYVKNILDTKKTSSFLFFEKKLNKRRKHNE